MQAVVFMLNVCGFKAPEQIYINAGKLQDAIRVQHTSRHTAIPDRRRGIPVVPRTPPPPPPPPTRPPPPPPPPPPASGGSKPSPPKPKPVKRGLPPLPPSVPLPPGPVERMAPPVVTPKIGIHVLEEEPDGSLDEQPDVDIKQEVTPAQIPDQPSQRLEEEEEQQPASGGVADQPASDGVADDQAASGGVADDHHQPASGGVEFTIDRESDNAEPWEIYSSAEPWTEEEIEEFRKQVALVMRKSAPMVHRVKVGEEYDRFGGPNDAALDPNMIVPMAARFSLWALNAEDVVSMSLAAVAKLGLTCAAEVLAEGTLEGTRLTKLIQDFPKDPSGHHEKPPGGWPLAAWETQNTFLKDLMERHRGEVREIEGTWVLVQTPFPNRWSEDAEARTEALSWFCEQFCNEPESAWSLNSFRKGAGKEKGISTVAKGLNKGKAGKSGHWRQNLANRVVRPTTDNSDSAHLRRQAKCFNLAMVFKNCGGDYTAKELYEWYCAQEIIATKRSHGTSNPVRRFATLQRKAETGHYGFGKGK